MMYKTHVAFALFFYLLFANMFGLSKEFWVLLVVAIGSLLPDIDSSESYINKIFGFSKVIAKLSRHRGFWHSIFGLAAISFFTLLLAKILKFDFIVAGYLAIGYSLHLAADALTVSGIKPLWKLHDAELRWKIKTSKLSEYILFFILLALIIFLINPNLIKTLADLPSRITGFFVKAFK